LPHKFHAFGEYNDLPEQKLPLINAIGCARNSVVLMSVIKGQGATEYLVLLAVVLIVAMVAIALLGFFPGITSGAKKSESDTYWRGQTRPFSILEHTQNASTLYLSVQNNEVEVEEMTNISISGSGMTGHLDVAGGLEDRFFSAGEKKLMEVNMSGSCVSGNIYEYYVNFTYDSGGNARMPNQRQIGAKTLMGTCS
jgi:hypothetical protein